MDKVGKYLILGKLGQGGMGVVYKAMDTLLERVVALKTMSTHLDAEPELRARFFREGRSAAHLSHRNIITVYDIGEVNGVAYLAMEYLEGEDLKKKITRQVGLTPGKKLAIIGEVCRGLAHAHSRQIIHRDIKPANVFITNSGEVKILDFGLARMLSADITGTRAPVGTPNYMSPEQLLGQKVDHRADIFSVGALFYELLTSRRPFNEDSVPATIMRILQTDPEPLENLCPAIDPRLSAIVMKALAKDVVERYQSADELLGDLTLVSAELTLSEQGGIEEGASDTGRLLSDSAAGKPPTGKRLDTVPLYGELRGEHSQDSALTLPTTPTPARSVKETAPDSKGGEQASGAALPRAPGSRLGRKSVLFVLGASLLLVVTLFAIWWLRPQPSPPSDTALIRARRPSAPFRTGTAEPAPHQAGARLPAQEPGKGGVSEDPRAATANPPSAPGPGHPDALSRLHGGKAARESEETKSAIARGSGDADKARVSEVPRAIQTPGEPSDVKLQPDTPARTADDALHQMSQSRARAETAGAPQLASQSYQAARNTEAEAKTLYSGGQFQQAAAKLYEASGLYSSAALEAEARKEALARVAEQERQITAQRSQAEVSRQNYEQERLAAVSAEAPSRASEKFQEASKMGVQAQSALARQDYAAARTQFDAAAALMRESGAAAAEAARRASSSAAEPAPTPSPPSIFEVERAAILSTLQKYTAALQARDLPALKAVWTGLSGRQEEAIRTEFKNARNIRVQLVDLEVRTSGDSATVVARRVYVLQTLDGLNLETANRTLITLRKAAGSWLIEKIRFDPLR